MAVKLETDTINAAMIVVYNLTLSMITHPQRPFLCRVQRVARVQGLLVQKLIPFLRAQAAVLVVLTFVPPAHEQRAHAASGKPRITQVSARLRAFRLPLH